MPALRACAPTFLSFALALVFASGCAKQTTVKPEPPLVAPAPVATQAAPAAPMPAPAEKEPENFDAITRQSVLHFGFDDASLTQASEEKLRALADALHRRPGASVRIAGHCDERGTVEYNLALGQRRAAAARKYLVALGVPAAAVDTVSFGSEHPVAEGHDEAAWAQNRRAEAEPIKQ